MQVVPTITTHPCGEQALNKTILAPWDSCVPTLSPAPGKRWGQAAALKVWVLYSLHGGVKFGEKSATNAKGLDTPAPTLAVWQRHFKDHCGVIAGSGGTSLASSRRHCYHEGSPS